MKLYHPEVFMPEWFEMPDHRMTLAWSRHAREAAANDRYGVIPLFASIPLSQFQVVEIGVENHRLMKVVVRGRYNADLDVVFVYIPTGDDLSHGLVKTVWFNERNDNHRSLDVSRYARR